MSTHRYRYGFYGLLLVGLTLFYGLPPRYQTLSGQVFGTTYRITYQAKFYQYWPVRIHSWLIFRPFNQVLSLYHPDSWIKRFNQAQTTDPVPFPAWLYPMLYLSLQLSAATDGFYDITTESLSQAWGFHPQGNQTSQVIGSEHLKLTSQTIQKTNPALQIDLHAIAKGWAVDHLASMMAGYQIDHFMIEIGGDIFAKGLSSHQKPYRIGLESPKLADQPIYATIILDNQGLATSGPYRQFYQKQDQTRSHLMNPITQKPLPMQEEAITVMAPTCGIADAVATALSVMPSHQREGWIKPYQQLAMLEARQTPNGLITKRVRMPIKP